MSSPKIAFLCQVAFGTAIKAHAQLILNVRALRRTWVGWAQLSGSDLSVNVRKGRHSEEAGLERKRILTITALPLM